MWDHSVDSEQSGSGCACEGHRADVWDSRKSDELKKGLGGGTTVLVELELLRTVTAKEPRVSPARRSSGTYGTLASRSELDL